MRRTWKRMKWEPSEIHELRERIISNITLLDAFDGGESLEAASETLCNTKMTRSAKRYSTGFLL